MVDLYHGIEARVIGFPPENDSRSPSRSTKVRRQAYIRDDGVLDANGVVGRVASVGPLTSTIVLITDYTSRVPAVMLARPLVGVSRAAT